MAKASDNQFPKVTFAESAAPSTPASGLVLAYAKTDGKLYIKDDAGTETDLTATGGGGGSGGYLDYAELFGTGGVNISKSTTAAAAIDGTNLKLDFNWPASGKALFRFDAFYGHPSGDLYFYLATAAAPTTVIRYIRYMAGGAWPATGAVSLASTLSGTPAAAASIVIGWEKSTTSTTVLTHGDGGAGPIVFSVAELP